MGITEQRKLRHRDLMAQELMAPGRGAVLVCGMSGMGDNIHQRALIRRWVERGKEVWLETPWPAIYHDFPTVRFIKRRETLRTQARNVEREGERFTRERPPPNAHLVRPSYAPRLSRVTCVLDAMAQTVGEQIDGLDFRMDVPEEWRDIARALLRPHRPSKPILVYRPLVARTEWAGCATRNPDADAYSALFASIRERYFVVSIADLVPDVEWVSGKPIRADAEFHRGELNFELLAGLFSIADLTFASPGFAVVLSQAVSTPIVCVFGGFETNRSFERGAQLTPTLALGQGCGCFSHTHACDKAFDVPAAKAVLRRFVECQFPQVQRLIARTTSSGRASQPAS